MRKPHYPASLIEAVGRLAGTTVGVVGDVMADVYVSGLSDRVSREAPVLIVRYEREWLRPGGAANVAANVSALGATACLIGVVGDDEVGRRLLSELTASNGVHPRGRVTCHHVLAAPPRATITKTRFLAGAKLTSRQQVLRLDRAPLEPPGRELLRRLREQVAAVDPQVDAWVASDYGYGSFDEPLRDLLRAIARRKPVVADSRWEVHRFTGLSVLKPNEEEAESAAQVLGVRADGEEELAQALVSKLHARAVLITLGNAGVVLATGGRVARIPAAGTDEIVDLTGAGDTVAATLATAVAAGCDMETAARLANHAGGIVVMKEGAATASPDELRASIARVETSPEPRASARAAPPAKPGPPTRSKGRAGSRPSTRPGASRPP